MKPAEPKAPMAGAADRAPEVRSMFDEIAPKYDLANRVLSLGLDQWWRRQAIRALGDAQQGTVLDLCAGTLDLTRMLLDGGASAVVSVDFSTEMLAQGMQKIRAEEPVTVHCADARALPLDPNSVDGIICGFGLRNVPELDKALAECHRVLRPGGRMVVLDFFQPTTTSARLLQDSYNRMIVPAVGGFITGFSGAYRYLEQSIDAFVSADSFCAALRDLDMNATHQTMVPPVASLVRATLPEIG